MEAVTPAVPLVLLDNTVLSNFALVERSELLSQLWGDTICTTQEVLTEYARGVASGVVPAVMWNKLVTIELTKAEQQFAADLLPRLGAGELVRLVRDGCLTYAAADILLVNMIGAGFRSPVQHLGEIM